MLEASASVIEVFFSYAHEDEILRNELAKHLSILKRQGFIAEWHDRNISAGQEWAYEIHTHLNRVHVILLLVSPDFMSSDYCYSVEMKRAMERHKTGEARVIPVLLRPVDWKGAPFDTLQMLPTDAVPVTSWPDLDKAFLDIAKGIRKAIEELTSLPSNITSSSVKLVSEESMGDVSFHTLPLIDGCRVDWGEAPHIEIFYGREKEAAALEQWIIGDRCRLVAVLGIGGIGKTALAAKLAEQIKQEFEYVFWRSLQNAPPLESMLKNCIQFLSNQQQTDLPEDIDGQISLLLQYLRDQRCLLVLDNMETILQAGKRAGLYREGYEGYGKLIRRTGEAKHQSCLLLTSREKPKEIVPLEGMTSPIRSLPLPGLEHREGQELLKDTGLLGSDETWADLIYLYAGNPLDLKLAAEPIRELFKGDVASFLQNGRTVFGDIRDPLDLQFHRLSELERDVMYWLAIERESVSLDDLRKDMMNSVPEEDLLVALGSLRRRSMIETSATARFILQPVIMEYVTDRFVEQICGEISSEAISLLMSHALIKVQTKDYLRESQIRLILTPVAQQLENTLGKKEGERKLKGILSALRERRSYSPDYAAGNVLNLLVGLGCNLRGYNFSNLVVRQAYLQGVALPEVNFAHANLETSVFTETFGSVRSVAFSANRDLLAVGTINGEIWLWNAVSNRPQQTWRGHMDWVNSIAFSPDGKVLASGSDDHTIRLWRVDTDYCFKTLQEHDSRVYSVAFSPDGNFLASGSDDQTVRLWEVSTGQCLCTLQGHIDRVWAVAFSPDGNTLASGSEDQTIRLWEVSTGQCLLTLRDHDSRVCSVAFSPDGNTLASGSEDQTVRLWEVGTGQCFKTLQGHTSLIWSVAFSPNGSLLVSGSEDRTVRLWEVQTGQCFKILRGHTSYIWSVTFSSDGDTVASGSDDQTVRLWEVQTGQCLATLQGHTDRVYSIAFSPDGNVLASGNEDGTVQLWDSSTGQHITTLQGHTSLVWSVAFSPDGNTLASGSQDQTIRLWDVKTKRCFHTLQEHTKWVYSVAFSPDGKVVASSSEDGTIRLWEVQAGQCLEILQGHTNWVYSVAFSPDGNTLASGSEDQTIRIWNVKTKQCLKILRGHINRVWAVTFSPDGNILASSSEDGTIRLWEVNTGQCLHNLQEHTGWVWGVAFSPDGEILASGNNDATVRLWEVRTGQYYSTLEGHTDRIWAVAFSSPERNVLASGSEDGTIKLWSVTTGECLRTLRSERPYEHMNITSTKGLTEAQKDSLKALGAIENEE